jgi:hypothetical protein
MNKKLVSLSFIIIILISSGLFFFWENNKDIFFQEESGKEKQGIITLAIDKGEGEKANYNKEISGEITVFELLLENGIDIKYEEYDVGIFIVAIDGLENNLEERKNWVYYVNREQPGIGCDQKKVFPGDNIEWKYEETQW